jgi:hypothetical protein
MGAGGLNRPPPPQADIKVGIMMAVCMYSYAPKIMHLKETPLNIIPHVMKLKV